LKDAEQIVPSSSTGSCQWPQSTSSGARPPSPDSTDATRGQPALLKQAINLEEAIFSIQTYLKLALKSPLGNSIMEIAEQYPDIRSLTAALGGSKDAEVMAYTITYTTPQGFLGYFTMQSVSPLK
jgi:hypothetical protein